MIRTMIPAGELARALREVEDDIRERLAEDGDLSPEQVEAVLHVLVNFHHAALNRLQLR